MKQRAPEFRALEGLEQKYYLHDPETGEYGGFYVWRSLDDVVQYRQSDLAASIAAAYQGVAAPEITVYEIVMPLRT
jgi:heme-degrading monooxygenase HmoA